MSLVFPSFFKIFFFINRRENENKVLKMSKFFSRMRLECEQDIARKTIRKKMNLKKKSKS